MRKRVLTACERIYREWLHATNEDDEEELSGQLKAICVSACRARGLSPPVVMPKYSDETWEGGFLALPGWVSHWVDHNLHSGLKDDARYIGRRCVYALIDEIRWHQRRRREAEVRIRIMPDDAEEVERLREGTSRVLAEAELPGKLPLAGDKELFNRFAAAYPAKLSNVAIARELGLSEGAIRNAARGLARSALGLRMGITN